MRNLKKYPVTLEEIEACLRELGDEYARKQIPGDMTPTLLREAATIVQRTGFVTYGLGDPRSARAALAAEGGKA